MNINSMVELLAGGPGSGCRGPNCGRPLGSGLHNYRQSSVINNMFEFLRDGRPRRLRELYNRFGEDAVGFRLRTLAMHGEQSGNWRLNRDGNHVTLTITRTGRSAERATQTAIPVRDKFPDNPNFRKKSGHLEGKETGRPKGRVTVDGFGSLDIEDSKRMFEQQFGMVPEKYLGHLTEGLPNWATRNMRMNIENYGGKTWSINLRSTAFSQTRTIDMARKTAHHDYWSISRNRQGGGLGKQIFNNQLDLYDHLGIKKVEIGANIDVGGYAWAKYGFVPGSSDWRYLKNDIKDKIRYDRLDSLLTKSQLDKVNRILSSNDPTSIRALAGLKEKVRTGSFRDDFGDRHSIKPGTTLGQAMLLNTNWDGELNLDDEKSYKVARAYVSGGTHSGRRVRAAARKMRHQGEPVMYVDGKKTDAPFHEEMMKSQAGLEASDWLAVIAAMELGWSLEDAVNDFVHTSTVKAELADIDSVQASIDIQCFIRKEGNEHCVKSHKGKNLGCYPSRGGAEKRLKQVEYFKHLKADGSNPFWIGVDFDKTLVTEHPYHPTEFGDPNWKIVRHVKKLIARGENVRLFTARAKNEKASEKKALQAWMKKYLGQVLQITCVKDKWMKQLIDDKAVDPEDIEAGGPGSGRRPTGRKTYSDLTNVQQHERARLNPKQQSIFGPEHEKEIRMHPDQARRTAREQARLLGETEASEPPPGGNYSAKKVNKDRWFAPPVKQGVPGSLNAGGPGSGCQGPNCGRPLGSGSGRAIHNYRAGSVIYQMFDLLRDGQPHTLQELHKRFGEEAVGFRLRTLAQHGSANGRWSLQRTRSFSPSRSTVRLIINQTPTSTTQSRPKGDTRSDALRRFMSPSSTTSTTTPTPPRPLTPPPAPVQRPATVYQSESFRPPRGFLNKEPKAETQFDLRRKGISIAAPDIPEFTDKFKMNPSDYMEQSLKGVPEKVKENATMMVTKYGGGSWSIEIRSPGFSQTRGFNFNNGTVGHNYWQLSSDLQGSGMGKTVFRNQLDIYDHLGLKKINVHANIDVGGYAWARFGFVPDADDWRAMRRSYIRKIDDSNWSADLKTKAKLICGIEDPKAAWLLAGMKDEVKRPQGGTTTVGKYLMKGDDWSGSIDLTKEDQYRAVRGYVGDTRIQAKGELTPGPFYIKDGKKGDAAFWEDLLSSEKGRRMSDWLCVMYAMTMGWSLEGAVEDFVQTDAVRRELTGGGHKGFQASGEPEINLTMAHIEPISTFHPPHLRNAKRVPADNPGETDDTYLDVTKRKEAMKERLNRLKRSAPGGLPPLIPVKTTGVEMHQGVIQPGVFSSALKRSKKRVILRPRKF